MIKRFIQRLLRDAFKGEGSEYRGIQIIPPPRVTPLPAKEEKDPLETNNYYSEF